MTTMHTYRVCDVLIGSNIVLPELAPAATVSPEYRFELLAAGPFVHPDIVWFHEWTLEEDTENAHRGQSWILFAHTSDGYLLRFPSCGDFFVSADTQQIKCRPLPEVPQVTIRHLLLDQIIPLVLTRRERIVLHASAVLTRHGVIGFAGRSGRGKSTLAAHFATNGYPLVSDDFLVLRPQQGSWTALPSYAGVRLAPKTAADLLLEDTITTDVAHYSAKRRVSDITVLPFSVRPAPLRGIFFLGENGSVAIARLVAPRAFMSLMQCAFNLDVTDTLFLRTQFEAVAQLATAVPAFVICYPRDLASLSAVCEVIVSGLEEHLYDVK